MSEEELIPFEGEEISIPSVQYEYLDHTADVQYAFLRNYIISKLHAWGKTLEEAFEQCGMAMYGYMTEIEYVAVKYIKDIEAEGHDQLSLLYHFLDELLYIFSAEHFFIARVVKILEFDAQNFKIKARCYGEPFEIGKHPQGTEVKAITYSNMQVHQNEGKNEVFVIIDI